MARRSRGRRNGDRPETRRGLPIWADTAIAVLYGIGFGYGVWSAAAGNLDWANGIILVVLGALGLAVLAGLRRDSDEGKSGDGSSLELLKFATALISFVAVLLPITGRTGEEEHGASGVDTTPTVPCQEPAKPEEGLGRPVQESS